MFLLGFIRLVADYVNYETESTVLYPCDSHTEWTPPTTGWVKLNTDAAMLQDGTVGMGGVVRGEDGRLKATMAQSVCAIGADVLMAEDCSMLFGLCKAKELGL
ncbi:hypothetical protein vseg_002571 [Gypsophila vaccaria]